MNKKRIALALSAALGINTLMITVGNINGQVQIVHAVTDTRLNDSSIIDTLKVKTLKVQTSMSSDGKDLYLSFPDRTDISNAKISSFNRQNFTERGNIDGNSGQVPATSSWITSGNYLSISGFNSNAPGIYTTEVTITTNSGATETYKISLAKTPTDTLTAGKVTVEPMSVTVEDLSLNGKALDIGKKVFLLNSSDQEVSYGKVEDKAGTVKFNMSGVNMKVGEVYKIVYGVDKEDASALYKASTYLVMTRADNRGYDIVGATNVKDALSTAKAEIAKDFGVNTDSVAIKETNTGYSVSVPKLNSSFDAKEETVLELPQTFGAASVLHGLPLTVTTVGNSLKVDFGDGKITDTNNYVPYAQLSYGNNQSETTLVGDYTATFNSGSTTLTTVSYAEFSNVTELKPSLTAVTNKAGTVSLGKKYDLKTDDYTNSSANLDLSSFEHGCHEISIDFGVSVAADFATQVNDAAKNASSATASTITPNTEAKIKQSDDKSGDSVKTSILLAIDDIDGVAVSSQFIQTDATKGKLLIKNGKSLFANGAPDSDIGSKLSVSGAKSVALSSSDTESLVYDVEFNNAVSDTISWELSGTSKVKGETAVQGKVAAANLSSVGIQNAPNTVTKVKVNAQFTSDIPGLTAIGFGTQNTLEVDVNELTSTGAKSVRGSVSSGKYQGTYHAGVLVDKVVGKITLEKPVTVTGNSVTLRFYTDFINEDDQNVNITKVNRSVIAYRRTDGIGGWNITELSMEEAVNSITKTTTKTITGLERDTNYNFVVFMDVILTGGGFNGETHILQSNVVTQRTNVNSSNNNNNITGNGSNSTSGSSTGTTSIVVGNNNSTKTPTSLTLTLPGSGYSTSYAPVVRGIKYKGTDGKVVTATSEQFANVKASYSSDGKSIILEGLVPDKDYTEISVDYTDNNNKTRTLVIRDFKLTSVVDTLESYLRNVYTVVFDRPADEAGYNYHLNNLKSKKVSLRDFLLNILNEKEFLGRYTTTEGKVEALYSAIVSRKSDEAGKAFWVNEYKTLLAVYGSEDNTLKAIADRMVNENELKELANKLGVQW